MVAKRWYFRDADGTEYGPFTGVELRRLVEVGRVRRDTPVRTDTSPGSVAASDVKSLFSEGKTSASGSVSTAATGQGHEPVGRPDAASRAKTGAPPEEPLLEEIDIGGYPGYPQPRGPVNNNVLAIVSLVSGILGWTIIPVVGAAAAIFTGHIALGQIERSRGREDGKILAVIGLILGYIEAALLFLVTISLFCLGISIAGLLSFLFQQVEREGRRHEVNPPRVERARAVAPVAPPEVEPGDPIRGTPKALGGEEGPAKADDAPGAGGPEGPEARIVAVPKKKPVEPPASLLGTWDVTSPQLPKPFIIEFAGDELVRVRYTYGMSSISPWSYRDGSIQFGGSIRINEVKVQGPWKTYWRGPDEVDVIDPEGQQLTLKRRKP